MEGLPLGIELAAGWARQLPFAEIACEIEESYRFLSASDAASPERHHSLTVAFDYSWERMTEDERLLLLRLSVFRGGFAREAAEQVANASLRSLAELMDRCLIQRTAGGRYRMHGLLAQYGREKLARRPEEESQTYERYCDYYTAFLQRAMAGLDGEPAGDALRAIAAEHADLDASWKWALAHTEQHPSASPAERRTSERFRAAMQSFGPLPQAGARL